MEQKQYLCIICHKRSRFERNGKRYNLCAECGLETLLKFVNRPDDRRSEDDMITDWDGGGTFAEDAQE